MKFFFAQQIAETRCFSNRTRNEATNARNCIAQLTALIAILEAMGDQDEVFDTLMCLRDDQQDENNRLIALNDVIVEAKEKFATKEAHVEIMEAASDDV
ncbi:hypothetical protein Tco_0904008 [Tanacetum coccineum]